MKLESLIPVFLRRPSKNKDGKYEVMYRHTLQEPWKIRVFETYPDAKSFYAKKAEKLMVGLIYVTQLKKGGKQNG